MNFVDTFKAPEPGYIGAFYNNKLYYFSTASQPTCTYSSPDALTLNLKG